jgi:hypothetical protein
MTAPRVVPHDITTDYAVNITMDCSFKAWISIRWIVKKCFMILKGY